MYYTEEKEKVLSALHTDRNGLDPAEAEKRLEQNGFNELAEGKKKNVLQVFFSQFADLLVIILIVSAVISALSGNGESAAVIVCVIAMNAVIGTVQHFKAERSLDSLKAMSSPTARVMRGGEVCEIPAREVCTGDIMLLEAGNIATADGRVIEAASLMANESSLTGESTAAEKSDCVLTAENGREIMLGDRVNMIYSGSLITSGRGVIVVTETGMNTEIGKIAALINTAESKKTPLQKSLDGFSRKLSVIILVICALVMLLSVIRGERVMDALMFAVALAVAAIPEALSSIVTISLALGTQKMAKENAIIKELKAVEGLGCVSVICSDKTGTLTRNKMTVREIYCCGKSVKAEEADFNNNTVRSLARTMALCSDAVCGANGEALGDPTETALLDFCGDECCKTERAEYPRLGEIPFDSDRKLMSTMHFIDGKVKLLTKGACDVLLERLDNIYDMDGSCRRITSEDIERIEFANSEFSQKGMRVLCFAEKEMSGDRAPVLEDEYGYTFIGLAAMTDPPRPESTAAVSNCKKAGIKPVMITGDHKITASAIAREIGIMSDGDLAFDGSELERISDEELVKLLPKISVYARVSPAHKIRIVTLWQSLGKVVAMTGDGVNDAPALKKADVGIAMGITGTQVSKDAASMILTDDNFATIVKSVSNGRTIYRNIGNSIKFLV
ncbi:MAG: cation-translocating P-type ATPase [Huintestinicola sp.]